MRGPSIIGLSLFCLLAAHIFALEQPKAQATDEDFVAGNKFSIQERKQTDLQLLDSLLARLNRATGRTQARTVEKTIRQLWLRVYSPSVEVLMQQAIRATKNKQYAAAMTLLDIVIELAPDYAEGWKLRATIHYHKHEYERSLVDIEQVLKLEPRHFDALVDRGRLNHELNRKRQALEAFYQALEIHPFLGEAKLMIEILEKEIGDEKI